LRMSQVTPSLHGQPCNKEGLGHSTHPGRQYSTTNLNTPCRSGAIKRAL
jgi:hypothetical protein